MKWTETFDRILFESLRKWFIAEGFRRKYIVSTEHRLDVDRQYFRSLSSKRSDRSHVDIAWITGNVGVFSRYQTMVFGIELESGRSGKQVEINREILSQLGEYYGFSSIQVAVGSPVAEFDLLDKFAEKFFSLDTDRKYVMEMFMNVYPLFSRTVIRHGVIHSRYVKGFKPIVLPKWRYIDWFRYLVGDDCFKVLSRNLHPEFARKMIGFIKEGGLA